MQNSKPAILIIGCGVSGLSCGMLLRELGYPVKIQTKALPTETTSGKAAAIWMPFQAKPQDLVNRWSLQSFHRYLELAKQPQTGVSFIPFLTVDIPGQDNSWVKDLPKAHVKKATADELPNGYHEGYISIVPLIETPIYLDYLVNKFLELGGQIEKKAVTQLEETLAPRRIVVNCTGLAAKDLTGDEELYPIRGQIVKVAPVADVQGMSIEPDLEHVAYIIPRRDAIILGGTVQYHSDDLIPREKDTAGILARCKELEPNLKTAGIKEVIVGLRPGRSSIRLEKEADRPLIHNYGHGGSGYTVAWGCAAAVVELVEEMAKGIPK